MPDIAIGRRETRMAELCLDHVHTDAFPGEFRRMGVSEAVSMHSLLDASFTRKTRQQGTNVRRREWGASEGAEHTLAAVNTHVLTTIEPPFDKCERARV